MDSTQYLPFRFLALPQELRDYIYSDILTTTYVVKLGQIWINLTARRRGRPPPPPHRASSRLAILRVSKSVHYEAKQILFRLGTFRFKIPNTGLPLYEELGDISATPLMQNIIVKLSVATAKTIQPITSVLHIFGGSNTPRSTCVIQVHFAFRSDFLLEAAFLDALGKLTGFKTVLVKLKAELTRVDTLRGWESSTYKILDEYLRVILGAGEAGKFDEDGIYCMTYHPRRLAFQRMISV